MPTQTITGTLVRSRTVGPRGGVTHTLTDANRTQTITWNNFEEFHLGSTEVFQNATISIEVNLEHAKQVQDPGSLV